MVQVLFLALCVLIGVALLYRWFVAADPKTIRTALAWVGGLLALGLLALFLARGNASILWWMIFAAAPMLLRWRRVFDTIRNIAKARRGPSPGQSSTVRTEWVAMTLDHDSGDMTGEVLKGPFAGRSLGDLSLRELLDLLTDCQPEDEQSAQLVESYLDRMHGPAWRETDGGSGRTGPGSGQKPGAGAMTRAQALGVLGLSEGATEAEIRDAHRRLMLAHHPDRGGSQVLAAQINQAKDVLLG